MFNQFFSKYEIKLSLQGGALAPPPHERRARAS